MSGKERQHRMTPVAIILVLVFTGNVLLVSRCVEATSLNGVGGHAQTAAVSDALQDAACLHELLSVVPTPDRPSLGQAVLPPLPVIAGAVPSTAIAAPPPDYPRAMARALLQIYRM